MSDATTTHRVRTLRRWRAVLVPFLLANIALVAYNATRGSVLGIFPLLIAGFVAREIGMLTGLIRRCTRAAS